MSQSNIPSSTVQSFDPNTGASVIGQSVDTGEEQAGRSNHWEVRTQEQGYSFLSDKEIKDVNRYGQKIDLVELTGLPEGKSMFINDNPDVGTNPNRNKQHGFFFTADNCIGCHACEAACSEKNENPPHLAFRSVGYVEGGSFPDYKRMNISMACNHCDDPVCLRGCPTKAYTKHAEYGAVLQDPETCFGCGYCTWVCPYNAPQLDPVKGQVSKCNMCVDRLEVGLKPACVSACVGNALDFGVVENTPENREQCKTQIPGFPDPEITHPNVRFQQTKTLPDEMSRTDSVPIKYNKDKDGNYKPMVDQKAGKERTWNFGKLSSRENPLVLFTLACQAAFGAFAIVILASLFGVDAFQLFVSSNMFAPFAMLSAGLTGFGLLMSVTHLGKPMRFYRGFNNLRLSPVCREGLGFAMFIFGTGLAMVFALPSNVVFAGAVQSFVGLDIGYLATILPVSAMTQIVSIFAVVAGSAGLYYMYRCYRIKARPFWDHWQTATTFVGSSIALGALVTGIVVISTLVFSNTEPALIQSTLVFVGLVFALGLLMELVGLWAHNRDMSAATHEGAASHYVQCTTFGKTYVFRNILLSLCLAAALGLVALAYSGFTGYILFALWLVLGLSVCASALIGRALFYVLVIPTTMPGAFFWKNKSFEQHARDIGLANMPQVGVAPDHH